jgi:hypothetical protein
MVAVASCFAQMLTLIDRMGFARAVHQHAAERAAKGSVAGTISWRCSFADGERPLAS